MAGGVDGLGGLEQIEDLANAMVKALGGAERRRLLRRMARAIEDSQRRRIAAQVEPDGTPFAPRKARRAENGGGYPVRFLYPKGAQNPRRVSLRNWRRQGPLITGFDIEVGGIRSFFWDKVAEWLPADDLGGGGKLRRRGAIRRRAMFRALRGRRWLRSDATENEAWAGFSGHVAQIARVHQDGLTDRVAKNGRSVRYARRRLIGLTDADRAMLLDLFFDHVAAVLPTMPAHR